MELIPILEHAKENPELIGNPLCQDSIYMSIDSVVLLSKANRLIAVLK